MKRQSKRTDWVPFSFQSVTYGVELYLEDFAQVTHATRMTKDSKITIAALIPVLLVLSGPIAILFVITKFVVPSFNFCSGWLWTHVLKKIFKLDPSFADGNSFLTIPNPTRAFFAATPVNHGVPAMVNAGLSHAMRLVIFKVRLLYKTSARFCIAAHQAFVSYFFWWRTTGTLTQAESHRPSFWRAAIVCLRNNCYLAEDPSDDALFSRHNVLSKFPTLCLVVGDWRQPITRYDYE